MKLGDADTQVGQAFAAARQADPFALRPVHARLAGALFGPEAAAVSVASASSSA